MIIQKFLCLLVDHSFESDDGPYTGTCRRCGIQHYFIHDGSFPVRRATKITDVARAALQAQGDER